MTHPIAEEILSVLERGHTLSADVVREGFARLHGDPALFDAVRAVTVLAGFLEKNGLAEAAAILLEVAEAEVPELLRIDARRGGQFKDAFAVERTPRRFLPRAGSVPKDAVKAAALGGARRLR
ncbi:MAG: hypothetical protein U1E65_20805 [Myxococcota bacterium]